LQNSENALFIFAAVPRNRAINLQINGKAWVVNKLHGKMMYTFQKRMNVHPRKKQPTKRFRVTQECN